MKNKARYEAFCKSAYVPIYSQPWWMDAICGSDGWDVWLYSKGDEVLAAMPYYLEERAHGLYITKAPLTQNNGIIFKGSKTSGAIASQKLQEHAINAANEFIESLGLAVYEQQYQTSFTNWLPFSWHGYSALPRYTYILNTDCELDDLWRGMSTKQRGKVKKGKKNTTQITTLPPDEFYEHHKRIFDRQGLPCPFSFELWKKLESACRDHGCSASYAAMHENEVASLIFLVWDDRAVYQILGGSMPGLQKLDTYAALIWHGITIAHDMGRVYDFEGSMIERISKSFREFGGTPRLYFRIRKVFSPDVIRMEAEQQIERLER